MTEPSPSTTRHMEATKINTEVAHAARVYDYLLGGTDNFAVDREAAEQQAIAVGGLERARVDIRANRDFLGRAVRYMADEAGIRQFLDLGTGIPNADNVHAVAQKAAPESRIVYVDNDPIVLAHAHALLKSTSEGAAAYVDSDLRDTDQVLQHAAATLDLTQPVAVMLLSVLHLVPDGHDPYGIITRLMDAVPSGSHLVLSHLTKDIQTEAMTALEQSAPPDAEYAFIMRDHAAFSRFFDGLELVEPGVVSVSRWRPDGTAATPPESDTDSPFYCGVGRKA